MRWTSSVQRVFQRDLPDHGFVAIDVRRSWSPSHGLGYRGDVIVERRSADRRASHQPPIIASASRKTIEGILQDLLPAAQSNTAVGAALVRQPRPHTDREPHLHW